jgi:hypothetical protein
MAISFAKKLFTGDNSPKNIIRIKNTSEIEKKIKLKFAIGSDC